MRRPLSKAELRIVAAWWQVGSVRKVADLIDVSEQTVKNTMYMARLVAGVKTNEELIEQNWKLLLKTTVGGNARSNEYRRMRYELDPEYRERMRRQARDGMRKRREAEMSERRKEYDRLLSLQGNACGICGKSEMFRKRRDGTPFKLAVDHDHATGTIRALLCSTCNVMLGCAKDDPEHLEKAAEYLRRHAQSTSHNKRGKVA